MHVKHFVWRLRAKWMIRLWEDKGQTWLCFAWQTVLVVYLLPILARLAKCKDILLKAIPKFYADVLRAFAEIYRLSVQGETGQQRNIWASTEYPGVSKCMIEADVIEVADLPVKDGVIDYKCVQQKVQQTGFLLCVALQKIFGL